MRAQPVLDFHIPITQTAAGDGCIRQSSANQPSGIGVKVLRSALPSLTRFASRRFIPARARPHGGARLRAVPPRGDAAGPAETPASRSNYPRFLIESSMQGRYLMLRLVGELDADGAPRFERALLAARAEGHTEIVLDLGGLSFIDSSGLWAITSAWRWCRRQGFGFSLLPGSESVQGLFEVTGLVDALPFDGARGREGAVGELVHLRDISAAPGGADE
jgi:anti-sigma B factor antagonist